MLQGEENVQLDRGLNPAYRASALPTELTGTQSLIIFPVVTKFKP